VLAFWTVDCGIVSVEKSDPIRFPGQQSPHAHVVAGSSAYGPDATNDLLRGGDSCTSCDVQQDKSAYWTNQLYVAPSEALGLDEVGILGMGGVRLLNVPETRNRSTSFSYSIRLLSCRFLSRRKTATRTSFTTS
jgi:hypothetical protein